MRRFSVSRRAKGILAGVAFLCSVGAVSTKLLVGKTNAFCFCLPPVSQPAFTMPEETAADADIHGGAIPGRVAVSGAPLAVTAINAPAATTGISATEMRARGRELAHLGVLWGTSNRMARGSSSSGGHFAAGGASSGGMLMGGHSATTQKSTTTTVKPAATPKAPRAAAPPSHAPAAAVIVPPTPTAAPVLPPTDTSGSTFGSNTAPVPGFGNGSTAPVATAPSGSLGGTVGGTVGGGRVAGLSVTPEPTMWLLMITGVIALFIARRRETQANS